jgi:hypothetical protein
MNMQIYDKSGVFKGTFDGEYLYDLEGKMFLRVDGDEVYTMDIPCKYVGVFEQNIITQLDGTLAYTIS